MNIKRIFRVVCINIKELFKNYPKKTIIITTVVFSFLCIFSFMCSIRFRLDYYLFHFSIDTHDYVEFKEYKSNFENLVAEIDDFVESTPDFFEEYSGDCDFNETGLIFYKKNLRYPENRVLHSVNCDEWEETISCMYTFPEPGFKEIKLRDEYPKYIFFECSELTDRFFVYTRGEKPTNLINECWEESEYVKIVRLARGWYDIRPLG